MSVTVMRGVKYDIPPDPTYPPARVQRRCAESPMPRDPVYPLPVVRRGSVSGDIPPDPTYPAPVMFDNTTDWRRRSLRHNLAMSDETSGWRYTV